MQKKKEVEKGTFFGMPKDEINRKKCICSDHFLRSDIITAGRNHVLMPNAVRKLSMIQTEDANLSNEVQTIVECNFISITEGNAFNNLECLGPVDNLENIKIIIIIIIIIKLEF